MNNRILTAAISATFVANSVFAGGLAPTVQEEVIVIEEGPIASSGAQYVVGIVLLGLLLAASSDSSTQSEPVDE